MARFKRLILCLLIAAMMLSFAACGESNNGDTPDDPDDKQSEQDDNPPIDDDDGELDNIDEDPIVKGVDFDFSAGLDENGHWEGIRALDYVEMFAHDGLPVPSEIYTVPEETMEREMGVLKDRFSEVEQVLDRAVEDGDTVNIDYVGSIDGVPFDNGSTQGMGTNVTIGETQYIDDFLEQLIGHKPGDTVNVEVTFPEEYSDMYGNIIEELAGKDALFVTEINYIEVKIAPEITDEFVRENLSDYGWDTVEDMQNEIRTAHQRNKIAPFINEFLITEVAVSEIPEKLIKYQQDYMLSEYEAYAQNNGVELLAVVLEQGYSSVEDMLESESELHRKEALYSLVMQAVAEAAEITVDEADLVDYFSMEGIDDYSPYAEQFGLPYLKQIVLYQKVFDYLIDNAELL